MRQFSSFSGLRFDIIIVEKIKNRKNTTFFFHSSLNSNYSVVYNHRKKQVLTEIKMPHARRIGLSRNRKNAKDSKYESMCSVASKNEGERGAIQTLNPESMAYIELSYLNYVYKKHLPHLQPPVDAVQYVVPCYVTPPIQNEFLQQSGNDFKTSKKLAPVKSQPVYEQVERHHIETGYKNFALSTCFSPSLSRSFANKEKNCFLSPKPVCSASLDRRCPFNSETSLVTKNRSIQCEVKKELASYSSFTPILAAARRDATTEDCTSHAYENPYICLACEKPYKRMCINKWPFECCECMLNLKLSRKL